MNILGPSTFRLRYGVLGRSYNLAISLGWQQLKILSSLLLLADEYDCPRYLHLPVTEKESQRSLVTGEASSGGGMVRSSRNVGMRCHRRRMTLSIVSPAPQPCKGRRHKQPHTAVSHLRLQRDEISASAGVQALKITHPRLARGRRLLTNSI